MADVIPATIKLTGKKVKVYRLKQPTPTKDHVWCDYDTQATYTETELQFTKK